MNILSIINEVYYQIYMIKMLMNFLIAMLNITLKKLLQKKLKILRKMYREYHSNYFAANQPQQDMKKYSKNKQNNRKSSVPKLNTNFLEHFEILGLVSLL